MDTKERLASDEASPVDYYYAGGNRIPLVLASDLFVTDQQDFVSGSDPGGSQALPGDLRLVRVDGSALPQGKQKFPVFRAQGATLVALPEIRVEEGREEKRHQLQQWAEDHSQRVAIEQQDEDRFVLTPTSGSGGDALKIANELAEDLQLEMAQARFLRITPRPTIHPRR